MFTLTKHGQYHDAEYGKILFQSNDIELVYDFINREHSRIGLCEVFRNKDGSKTQDVVIYLFDDGEWVEDESEWYTITFPHGQQHDITISAKSYQQESQFAS
jgi:hypothetical protein